MTDFNNRQHRQADYQDLISGIMSHDEWKSRYRTTPWKDKTDHNTNLQADYTQYDPVSPSVGRKATGAENAASVIVPIAIVITLFLIVACLWFPLL
jgi:hypothetical protein